MWSSLRVPRPPVAACCDLDILLALDLIGHGRCLATGGQAVGQGDLAGGKVKGPQVVICHGTHEYEATLGYNAATNVVHARG